ncbi:putative RNA-directed DNA polymerase, partial [Tanacetum coccineum]
FVTPGSSFSLIPIMEKWGKQDEANPHYQLMESIVDLDLHVNENAANEHESTEHATFDHENQDTPDYDTGIDEEDNRDSTTTAGTENADETEPITIDHPEVANGTPNNTNIPDTPSGSALQETNDISQARYPTRSNRGVPKKQYQPDLKAKAKYPIGNYVSHHRLASPHALVVDKLSTISIPNDVHEAVKNEKWKKAMNEEMRALQKNQTWELVKLPPGKKRLDAVAKMNTIRIIISIAANQDWPLKQFDVKNAFLNGYLEEEVYMDPPPGFQASLKKIGYKQSDANHTSFVKNNGKVTTLIVYVDDMVVTGNYTEEMTNLQTILATEFELKDLGHLKYFLGIEVARSKSGISMCQRKYVLDLLTETGMLDCKPVETPIEMNHKLSILPDQVPTNKERYQRPVGKLIYLSHTRPDIAYAVSVVSRFMHAPSKDHMNAAYRILKLGRRSNRWKVHLRILYICWGKSGYMEKQETKGGLKVECRG